MTTPYAQLMHLVQQTDLKVSSERWEDHLRRTTTHRVLIHTKQNEVIVNMHLSHDYPYESEQACFKAIKAVMDYTTWH